jgi:hypothetical protein
MIQRSWQKRNYSRGSVRPASTVNNLWVCACGHTNLDRRLIDERATGGFCFEAKVTTCEKCGKERQK